MLSRSFDARDAPNKPYFQRKLTDSLSNIFNALPVIFRIAEVLSLLLLRKLQLHSITAIRKLKCTDPLKNNPLSTRTQRLRYAKHSKCHRFLQQPFSNAVSESESSAVKRLRTQPASRREGTQLSRKVNEMPPSFLKLNSPFRTPFRTFFRFRIGCSSYAFGHFCNLELKTHQIQPDFALLHCFQALKDDAKPKTARFRHKKKNIFQSPI
ncbi:MAG: hypothetical protein ACLTUM_09535 [Christensenellales bacterium]